MAWISCKDLKVWQKSMDLTDRIYKITKMLPQEERYVLSDQMRRAAVSIPSNIAEGHGRYSENEFRSFLSIAHGSCVELETQLHICIRQNYFTEDEAAEALALSNEVSKMLTAMILKLKNRTSGTVAQRSDKGLKTEN